MDKYYKDWKLNSNDALKEIYLDLKGLGYKVETTGSKIHVPVLYGRNGNVEKYFNADVHHEATLTVIEIEACLIQNVKYLVIAVRNIYITRNNVSCKLKIK